MSPDTWFDIGLVCAVGSIALFSASRIAKVSREMREQHAELSAQARARGLDPDLPTFRTIAELQAQERPGWHPIERFALRLAVRAWRQDP